MKTCCVLHNYVRERDGYKFEDTLCIPGLEEIPNGVRRATRRAPIPAPARSLGVGAAPPAPPDAALFSQRLRDAASLGALTAPRFAFDGDIR
ncbi:hypothetical protein EVAR_38509_1 [Eumeta japonica]|uniref:DDE Tnp4 domain-containing protein n=1 Tax=Eumeta variegata TaxID=151549 RepID=A0A4C1WEE4_EUMVA|nr:hypothetical protein EVAR_38509_1 [Eumeta japonica]